jgi:hypothetical protein
LLTSFLLREQSGASLIARSKRPWNQIIWRDGCMLGKADQLFFGLSGGTLKRESKVLEIAKKESMATSPFGKAPQHTYYLQTCSEWWRL